MGDLRHSCVTGAFTGPIATSGMKKLRRFKEVSVRQLGPIDGLAKHHPAAWRKRVPISSTM